MRPTVAQLLLQSAQLEIDAARRQAERFDLVAGVGALVHALQRERGASAIFLASGGQRFTTVRASACAESQPLAEQLCRLFEARRADARTSARQLAAMARALLGLGALTALRERVAARQGLGPMAVVQAYSRLIDTLIELVVCEADEANLPGTSHLLVALLHLVQGKEAAGQERAVGGLMLAGGRCEAAQQQRLAQLIDVQQHTLDVFLAFADASLADEWRSFQSSPTVAALLKLRQGLGQARDGRPLEAHLSEPWFEVCSERIAMLAHLQTQLLDRLGAVCTAQALQAEQALLSLREQLAPLQAAGAPEADPDHLFSATPAGLAGLMAREVLRQDRVSAELEVARQALQARKQVVRATALLMTRLSVDEVTAYQRLCQAARDQQLRLVDVARATLMWSDVAGPGPVASAAA